jgi:hypothetical protein
MWIERSRPGREAEEKARALVRASYPRAVSMYVDDGALVCDEATGIRLGCASAGDWTVEAAWLDAAANVMIA